MEKENFVWRRIGEQVIGQSSALFLRETIVEISGHRRVLIENHGGVIAYSGDRIQVKVQFGAIVVCGQKMEMTHMTKDQLVISGAIHTVALQWRENN